MSILKAGNLKPKENEPSGDRRDRELTVTVNAVSHRLADPVPTGEQILEAAGFLPASDHVLIQILRHGTRSIGLEEEVDLRTSGTEVFMAFRSDRIFRFTIDERGYEWGATTISEPELRGLAGVDGDHLLVLQRDGDDIDLDSDAVVVLSDNGTEHLRSSKRFVTVSIDGTEKTIRRGAYTTEELIEILGVEAGYLLNVVNPQGQLVTLRPGERVRVREGMKFFSQVPCGGSS